MTRYLRLILFFIVFTVKCYASGDTASMLHFTIENGFPSNHVYSVIQDNAGYLWFATDNGIVKYNGYTFKIFNTASGLPSNDIYQLFVDHKGRIWIHAYTYKIGYIENDVYKDVLRSSKGIISPWSMADDKKKVYFLYKENDITKLFSMDDEDRTQIRTITDTTHTHEWTGTIIGSDCKIWTFTPDSTLYGCDLSKGEKEFSRKSKVLFNVRSYFASKIGITSVFHDKIIDFGSRNPFFSLIDTRDGTLSQVNYKDIGGSDNEGNYTLFQYGDSLYLITTQNIYIFNSRFKPLSKISFSSSIPDAPQVSDVFNDRFRNTWYTTVADGVWCNLQTSDVFNLNSGLTQMNATKCVGSLKTGNSYWWDQKHLVLFEVNIDNTINKITLPPNTELYKVSYCDNANVYLCLNKGIYKLNTTTKKLTNIVDEYQIKKITTSDGKVKASSSTLITDPALVNTNFINLRSLEKIADNILLTVSSSGERLITLSEGEAKMRTIYSDRFSNSLFDSVNNLCWFYNINKLVAYNAKKDTLLILTPDDLKHLKINSINGIAAGINTSIYLLDNNKVVVYNPKLKKVSYYPCNFNLTDAFINVYKNTLFITGNFGIACATVINDTTLGDFRISANIGKYKYNRVYDVVVNTIGIVDINTDKGPYQMQITNLLNNAQYFSASNPDFIRIALSYPFQKQINTNDTIIVDQKNGKIILDAINYLGQGTVTYSYKIPGIYNDWQESASGEIATTGLKPNHYYLVKCLMKDNTWKSKELDFYIYEPPLWWQKASWQRIFWICGVLLVLGIILIIVLLTRNIVAKSNEKKRILTELELRAVYAQINPHFIFNTLSSTLYFINSKNFDDAYAHVSKFSRLMRAYLKSSQDRYITIADEIDMLRNYIDLQRTRFEGKFDFTIEIDNKLPVRDIKIPSLLLQPLVENAINHGLFHKGEGGLLQLKFMQGTSSDEMICIIEDNGIGRERSKEINKNNTARGESYGTKLTRQLIDVYKEFEKINIYLEYIDKQPPETGTIVKLTIKNIKYDT